MNTQQKNAFTLVELIIVTTILVILATIGFASFSNSIPDARDAERISELAKVNSALKLYKQNRGTYPMPGSAFELTNSATAVAYQGKLNSDVTLSTLEVLPLDPKIEIPYMYSITTNKKEFQLAATIENVDYPRALITGDYKTVAKNVLPTIVMATSTGTEITTSSGLFIFDNGIHNLPYELEYPFDPVTDGTSLSILLLDTDINFWQNSDYRTCTEIKDAAKSIGDGEYQILNNSGILTNTGCTSM